MIIRCLYALLLFPLTAFCCTDFLISTTDRTHINGRSMEFGYVFQPSIVVHPRGEKITSQAPNQQPGMSWTSNYGYVGLFDQADQFLDGFNENGLSVGALWLPSSRYPDVSKQSNSQIVSYMDFPLWILGNFTSIDDLKPHLENVYVYAYKVPVFNEIPPIHLAIHDAEGKSLVIEFIDGKMQVYDNPIGVLTNDPPFPWQVTNLNNYINLSAVNAKSATFDGTVLGGAGQGTGLLGIPGDWTPPSRFVRIALFKNFLERPMNAKAGAIAAIHLLNTVDIPFGGVRSSQNKATDFTQWVVIKDLTNKVLYYRTYSDPNVQSFELLSKDVEVGAKPIKIQIPLELVEPPHLQQVEQ